MSNNEWQIGLSGKLDKDTTQSSINTDITEIQNRINKIKVKAELDPNSITKIEEHLAKAFNQKVTVGNIQIDTSKVSQSAKQSGQQIGQNMGDSINKNLTYSLNSVKNNIDNVLKSVKSQNLKSADLSKMFNLNRADIDVSVLENVRTLVKEINKLGYESVKTGSESSVSALLNKVNALSETLMKFGSNRDLSAFKESLDVLDYFQGKKIFVDKSEAIANTGLSIKELNNQFRNLGVTFTSVKQGATQLDTVWEELFKVSPSMQQFTNLGDQINAVVNQLKVAKEALYGNKNLVPVTDEEVSKPLVSYIHKIDNLMQRMNIYKAEEQELNQTVAQASTSSTATVVQNEQKKQQAYEQTNKVQKALTSEESVIKSGAGVRTFDSVKEAQEYFKELLKDEQAVIATTERFGQNNNLTSFTVNIKRATGEVESLRYAVDTLKDDEGNIEQIFYRLNGSVTGDSGAIKQIKDIENAFSDYTAKLSQFKSTNSEILSGLTTPLSDFESKLAGLKNGTSTINEVTNAYKSLNAEASNITKNFSRQLSPIDSAIRNLAKGEETISGLRAEFKGLNNAPKEINTELNKCAKLLENVKKIESQQGRTENWSQAYRQWSDSVDTLQAKLETLRKEQSNVASTQIFKISDLKDNNIAYMSKVFNTIEKQMVEINRMASAKGWNNVDVSGVEQADGKIKKLTLTVRDAEGALKKLDMQREKLQGNGKAQYGLMQVGDVKVLETASQAQEKLAQSTEKANAKLAEQVNKIQRSLGANGDTTAKIKVLRNDFTKLGLSADEVKTKMSNVDSELRQLKSLINSGASYSAIVSQFDKLKQALTQTQNNLKTTRSEYGLLATEQQRLSLANYIEKWMQTNSAATSKAKTACNQYITTLRDLNTEVTKLELANIRTNMGKLENSMRSLGKLGASLKNQWTQAVSSFSMWLSASSMVMKLISETRESITTIKELDDTLTEISKTSDMTKQSLEELGMTAYDTASKYGRTANDYLNAFESMSRSGFYGEIGKGMSELSLLAQSAGDMTQEVADNYLIATNAAYKYEGDVEKLGAALDGMNMITNRNSVALEDMSLAMSIAGTTAANYGVSIENVSAMIGTMEAVTKSGGGEVGNSLKSILINLQNVTSSKITGTLQKANASMTEFVDGTERLRNPIEILKDLSKTFNELNEDDPLRAEIITNVGGKYQANKLAALLSNQELFDKMLTDYSEGSGSALEEANVCLVV